MKQTAVEWLVNELQKADYIPKDSIIIDYVIKYAEEMEKQQITDAYSEGKTNGMDISHPLSLNKEILAEQYYNEQFKE